MEEIDSIIIENPDFFKKKALRNDIINKVISLINYSKGKHRHSVSPLKDYTSFSPDMSEELFDTEINKLRKTIDGLKDFMHSNTPQDKGFARRQDRKF